MNQIKLLFVGLASFTRAGAVTRNYDLRKSPKNSFQNLKIIYNSNGIMLHEYEGPLLNPQQGF